jgi:hypothetical protein
MKVWTARIVLMASVAAALALAPAAAAKDGDVRVAGKCSAGSASKLKLSDEDGRIEAEVEVDQNRNGVRWRIVLLRNGKQAGQRVGMTKAPSGSFEARFVTANGPGPDRFVARATRAGEVCTARASF